ncbi:MAG: Uncharacterised protein [Cryomorphaceae bacterium]|nr:MAG: Uncharacterised protein [Cryomorphaceae bacterium]
MPLTQYKMPKSNQDLILAGLFRLAWAFPFIFVGPALFVGKGTSGAWYWTVISIAIMATGAGMAVMGLRKIMKGFFGD